MSVQGVGEVLSALLRATSLPKRTQSVFSLAVGIFARIVWLVVVTAKVSIQQGRKSFTSQFLLSKNLHWLNSFRAEMPEEEWENFKLNSPFVSKMQYVVLSDPPFTHFLTLTLPNILHWRILCLFHTWNKLF